MTRTPKTPPDRPAAEIVVEGLGKSFGGRPVLDGVDLQIDAGDVVAIVGGSGCGKTVLLNHVLGKLVPDRGRVLVRNHARPDAPLCDVAVLHERELDEVHTHWGVVFQRNALFSGTVLHNLALGLAEVHHLGEAEILPIARRALAAVGLPDTPAFLATNNESLSGGMAKRLAVARALALQPVVIFYDEPTSGLDPASAAQIQDLIHATQVAETPGGTARTTVIITHDKDLLSRLRPRTVMLHEGKVFFDGTFEAFGDSRSAVIRPYFDLMPVLHQRAAGQHAPSA